jgi:hypothetical protein
MPAAGRGDNITIADLNVRPGSTQPGQERRQAEMVRAEDRPHYRAVVVNLSSGNQQKVVGQVDVTTWK